MPARQPSPITAALISEIQAAYTGLVANAQTVCTKICQGIDQDPWFIDHLLAACPHFSRSMLRKFEAVGRGTMDLRILTGGYPFANLLANLSLDEQRRALDESIELLVRDGDSLLVQLETMTRDQAKQVFAHDHIRNLAEQRTYLEDLAMKTRQAYVPTDDAFTYDTKRGELVILKPTRIKAADLFAHAQKLAGG